MPLEKYYFHLPEAFCIRLSGEDAGAVLNNLCTNDIRSLGDREACEGFITNLRGWVVVHAVVNKQPDGLLLIGQHPSPPIICQHIDRYIVREKAEVIDLTPTHSVLAILDSNCCPAALAESALATAQAAVLPQGQLAIVDEQNMAACEQVLQESEYQLGSEAEFEWYRIRNFWPRAGREITEKTIPQELDRDTEAINFQKGCYLGQETIARLDARGQLQKKLCLLECNGDEELKPGDSLHHGERQVGQVTSASQAEDGCYALAYLKRGSFDAGTALQCGPLKLEVLSPRSFR